MAVRDLRRVRVAALVLFKAIWLAVYGYFVWNGQAIIGFAPPVGLLLFAWATYEFVAAMLAPRWHLRGSAVAYMRDHPEAMLPPQRRP